MAMTANERKRAQIQREQEELWQMPDSTYPYLSVPYFEYLEDDPYWDDAQQCFERMGIMPPRFDDDRGPVDVAFDDGYKTDEDKIEAFKGSERSIGRAEVMVGQLIDAASELARSINKFKRKELEKSLAQIQQRDLTDPQIRATTMAEVVSIARMQEELEKNVRRGFPQWVIKIPPRR